MSNPKHEVRRVGIVGASSAAVGIAMNLLDADVPVTLFEHDGAALAQALAQVREEYARAVAQGDLSADGRDRRLALLAGAVNFHHLKDADLIIDGARAGMPGQDQLFGRLDQVAKRGAILVSTCPRTGIDGLAARTRRPGEVLGLRLAGAGSQQPAWELVPGKDTSGDTLATVSALAHQLRKLAPSGAAV